ncbi:MAG: hypothetical protein ACXVH7_03460 [Thermoanaerobaculia bacterium]
MGPRTHRKNGGAIESLRLLTAEGPHERAQGQVSGAKLERSCGVMTDGALIWLGLYFRDDRLKTLTPHPAFDYDSNPRET